MPRPNRRWAPSSSPPRPARSATARCFSPTSNRPCASAPKRRAIPPFEPLNNLNLIQYKTMKRILLTLALIATTALGVYTARADDTNAPAVAATNAPAAASTNAVAAWTTNAPTSEQRLESVEAYYANTDPTAPYQDTN